MTASELNLRVSVATLVRVFFENPRDGELMLAPKRRATLREGGRAVEVKSRPFGGAIRILEPGLLRDSIGDFHFDRASSGREQDFPHLCSTFSLGISARFLLRTPQPC